MLAKLIPAPVTRLTLELDPLREKLVATGIVGPKIVMACNDCDKVMLLLPTNVTEPELITEVAPAVLPLVPITMALWTEGVVAEIVILPAPAPTLTIPDPEMFRKLENVPEELLVVLPSAVKEIDDV